MDAKRSILVVDDALFMAAVIEKNLTEIGYKVQIAKSAEEALEKLKLAVPDLILLDVVMPGMSGFDLCKILRKNPRYNMIPIIMITGQSQEEDKVRGLELGADDYIVKPFVNRELIARVNNTLTRLERVRNLNPLSWLQGNHEINKEISQRIQDGDSFAVMYLDLNDFKSYNDTYGFSRGDDIIRMTAKIMTDVVEKHGMPLDFTGHIGGDDFVIVAETESAEILAEKIIERFEIEKKACFTPEDWERGYIVAANRSGIVEDIPLVGLSIAVILCVSDAVTNVNQLGEIAAVWKKKTKALGKSGYLIHEE